MLRFRLEKFQSRTRSQNRDLDNLNLGLGLEIDSKNFSLGLGLNNQNLVSLIPGGGVEIVSVLIFGAVHILGLGVVIKSLSDTP